jgi:hypothetical protein
MIKLGLYVTIRVVNAVIHNPILITVRVDLETVDHAASFDQTMCIATALITNQLDAVGLVSI